MTDVNALATVGYDTSINIVQYAEVIVETRDDAMRWIKWMTGQGYTVSGPYPWDRFQQRVTFTQTRNVIADSRRGDKVALDGRYEVIEGEYEVKDA